jgi:hypothetical protein
VIDFHNPNNLNATMNVLPVAQTCRRCQRGVTLIVRGRDFADAVRLGHLQARRQWGLRMDTQGQVRDRLGVSDARLDRRPI